MIPRVSHHLDRIHSIKRGIIGYSYLNIEEMKQNKRMVERAARKIERERVKIEGQEAKHLKEIQKLAKAGQHVRSDIDEN